MKRAFLPCLLLLSFITLSSGLCNKNNDAPDTIGLEHYPQTWILTVDESADMYTYLEVNGNNMKRSHVLKTYSLIQLAEDNECQFKVSQTRTEDGSKICFALQGTKNKNRWLFAGPSSNKQEIHLSTTVLRTETPPDDDGYLFFIHDFPKENGVKTVALESVGHPGYYLSSAGPGFHYSPTQATFQKESSPEKATKWQCR